MSPLADLLSKLEFVLPRDRRELRARIGGLEKRLRDGAAPDPRALRVVEDAITRSIADRERRASIVPKVGYPSELPVTAALPALRDAIGAHQVVVVAGETGSGKSTQLPKLCLELGRGVLGRIAHTQPRRIAARSVARRVADELGVKLGGVIGVKVRFGDESGRDTLVKVLTDGMLLAETRGDSRLDEYDTIIVDEAHERSLNIDFLLGYIRRLLPRRPDLKVILTSATIDVERLSAHFAGCPIVEIPGRAFPIEMRYRPPEVSGLDEEDPRMLEHLGKSIDEIDEAFLGRLGGARPDVLVFMSGEREIREAEQFLSGRFKARGDAASATEVLSLYARQSLDEQERIFSPGKLRRIVLATNVAETSLTVPRIHAVVDPGYARILRYSAKSRVQRLPIEPISQASARQRAGRAGRLGPGVAVRLYAEEDFASRPEFTPPEILRTNLAAVILQMEALNLGKAEDFPFVDPPSARLLADGRATLVELGASTIEGKLTKLGRSMSLFPLDPRLSRMLLASIDERCTNDVLVAVAALAVQDPRVRPQDKRDAADLAHLRFRDSTSDFVSFLRIWSAWRSESRDDAGKELGSSAKRRWCEKNFLSYQRMREWSDTIVQLKELLAEHFQLKIGELSRDVDHGAFHRCVLAGFASHVGVRNEKGEYRGPSGALFQLHPSGTLARRAPNWIVAAEIVETTKRYARICARIQPDWIVRVAPHLCSRSQFEPHFVEETGQVAAWERTSFGELVVVPKRRVPWGPLDPEGARNVFIQEGLVQQRARTEGTFLQLNRELIEELRDEEARGRRRGLLLEEEAAFRFYDERIPKDIHSTPSFERWRRDREQANPELLVMQEQDLLRDDADRVDPKLFPRALELEELKLPLDYAHDPQDARDGVTARIPVEALAVLDPAPFEWLVPGLLGEKTEALVRSLPKHIRVRLFPIEEVVQGAVEAIEFGKGSLKAQLARHLSAVAHAEIDPREFREDLLPPHLVMRFSVVDADGRVLAEGRDLRALSARFAALARDRMRAGIDRARDPVALMERDEVTQLPDEPIPESIRYIRAGITLTGYPAFVCEEPSRIALRVLDTALDARSAHAAAVARLLGEAYRDAIEHHVAYDPLCEELVGLLGHAGETDAIAYIARTVASGVISETQRIPRAMDEFLEAERRGEFDLHDRVALAMRTIHAILVAAEEVDQRVRGSRPDPQGDSRARVAARLQSVVADLDSCGREELSQRLRLANMLRARLERMREIGGERDLAIERELEPLARRVAEAVRDHRRTGEARLAIARMWEEIEISRFAPKLPRAFAASERRLEELLDG
ncbi:MAG: ATP-dependent helicase HrpA [Planctomycetota bacterium]